MSADCGKFFQKLFERKCVTPFDPEETAHGTLELK